SRGHVEARRAEHRPGSVYGHDARQLGEAHVKADAQSQPAELGVKGADLVPGRKGVALLEVLPALDGYVKEVALAAARRQFALPVEHKAGVVELASVALGYGAANQPDAVFTRGVGEHPAGVAAVRLLVGDKALVAVLAAEHLRQTDY